MNRVVAVGLAAGVMSCTGGGTDRPLSPNGFVGTELTSQLPKPDFEFTDSRGKPFSLAKATAGKVTLLFFGYTHCPDVCPVHLANLAAVLDKLPDEVQRGVSVVFITTDPARDSPPVLDAWVKGFSPTFVGLTASDSVLHAAQQMLRIAPKGGDLNGHAAQVIAFTRDGLGRVEYPFGTRQRDWAHDLPRLLAFGGTM